MEIPTTPSSSRFCVCDHSQLTQQKRSEGFYSAEIALSKSKLFAGSPSRKLKHKISITDSIKNHPSAHKNENRFPTFEPAPFQRKSTNPEYFAGTPQQRTNYQPLMQQAPPFSSDVPLSSVSPSRSKTQMILMQHHQIVLMPVVINQQISPRVSKLATEKTIPSTSKNSQISNFQYLLDGKYSKIANTQSYYRCSHDENKRLYEPHLKLVKIQSAPTPKTVSPGESSIESKSIGNLSTMSNLVHAGHHSPRELKSSLVKDAIQECVKSSKVSSPTRSSFLQQQEEQGIWMKPRQVLSESSQLGQQLKDSRFSEYGNSIVAEETHGHAGAFFGNKAIRLAYSVITKKNGG